MTQATRDKAEREMMMELRALQEALKAEWIDTALPEDWHGLEDRPIARAREGAGALGRHCPCATF